MGRQRVAEGRSPLHDDGYHAVVVTRRTGHAIRAYPDNPAQRYVMRAKAKWSIAI
jgi:hypothetical protein